MRSRQLPIVMLTVAIVAGSAVAAAEEDSEMIATGEPFVGFELPSHDGSTVSSASLEGQPYLLFFYPKADTPG